MPVGVALDRKGNLYVSNYTDSLQGEVLIYPRGSHAPVCTITDELDSNIELLTVGANGSVYVVDTPRNVFSYLAGQTTPHWALTTGMEQPFGVALGPAR